MSHATTTTHCERPFLHIPRSLLPPLPLALGFPLGPAVARRRRAGSEPTTPSRQGNARAPCPIPPPPSRTSSQTKASWSLSVQGTIVEQCPRAPHSQVPASLITPTGVGTPSVGASSLWNGCVISGCIAAKGMAAGHPGKYNRSIQHLKLARPPPQSGRLTSHLTHC
jgi:hypothetical protein